MLTDLQCLVHVFLNWICDPRQYEKLLLTMDLMKQLCVLKELHQLSGSHSPGLDIPWTLLYGCEHNPPFQNEQRTQSGFSIQMQQWNPAPLPAQIQPGMKANAVPHLVGETTISGWSLCNVYITAIHQMVKCTVKLVTKTNTELYILEKICVKRIVQNSYFMLWISAIM